MKTILDLPSRAIELSEALSFSHEYQPIFSMQTTANIIVKTVNAYASDSSFIGHIGEDDFIAVLHNYDYEEICQTIITQFDRISQQFYCEDELTRGYVETISRKGKLEKVPLVSLSIAIVSNKAVDFLTVEQLSKEAANVKENVKD